ncbi:P-loop NTPase family protein [Spelaeicoccus albus]|uniref:Protein ImuA n=1 Tax=Spelaeicoccus albus TaxID=1280376 RepID=A0A7Z0D415_9MICO|nr:hypothetical protein [Spelaeicoccus albus]NYI68475.1 hypothetical protein [Spelaeicoccus albus]
MSTTAAELAEQFGLRTASGPLAGDSALPVHAALAGLFRGGALRRGTAVSVDGRARLSLAYALAAEPSKRGYWCAVVGVPELGLSAAADLGIDPNRLIALPDPGEQWLRAVSILVETVDVLILAAPAVPPPGGMNRLHAKLRERQAVLICLGRPLPGTGAALTTRGPHWHGLDAGAGRLRSRTIRVAATGKLARPGTAVVSLPGEDGTLGRALPAVS